MKQSLASFFNQPKLVAAVSLILALSIGIFGYLSIHRAPAYEFATVASGTIEGTSNGTGPSHTQNLTLGFVSGGRIKSVSVKVGDTVKQGQVLATLEAGNASGALTQAKAAYQSAEANYQKVVNGATSPAINVAKAAVNTAQVNLDQATKQQAILVENAYKNYLNSTIQAKTQNQTTLTPPTISGSYTKGVEGTLKFDVQAGGDQGYLILSGIAAGTTELSTTTAKPLGDTGLYIRFPGAQAYVGTTWTITVPNTEAANYLTNKNAYDTAVQTKSQTLASLQAVVDQANATLSQTISAARPEDVASAKAQVDSAYGALQIAQASYDNTVIKAPNDGTVTAVSIATGEIAAPNAPAIEFLATVTSSSAALVIPKNAVIERAGKSYVMLKSGGSVVEREVTLGLSDNTSVEIISGLSAGDMVVTH